MTEPKQPATDAAYGAWLALRDADAALVAQLAASRSTAEAEQVEALLAELRDTSRHPDVWAQFDQIVVDDPSAHDEKVETISERISAITARQKSRDLAPGALDPDVDAAVTRARAALAAQSARPASEAVHGVVEPLDYSSTPPAAIERDELGR
ncbi:hypothetical protein [Nocardia asteroides]